MSCKEQTARYEVVIRKESLEEWTMYVSADSPEAASETAEGLLWDTVLPEFEIIDSEYSYEARPIDPRHTAEPTRIELNEGLVCTICLKPVEWTGMAADDPANTSGKAIPGPWKHIGSHQST